MHIAILTFDGFNEIDSFVALGVLRRTGLRDWRVSLASPAPRVTSMHGVVVESQLSLRDAAAADAVIVGSGLKTRDIVADPELMAQMQFDPARQLIAAQCSGTLILARQGLLAGVPACTDSISAPWIREAGVEVLQQPFVARGNVATAGGCLSSHYLAAWIVARLAGVETAMCALRYIVPVGEHEAYLSRAMRHVMPFLPGQAREPGSAAVPRMVASK